MRQTRTSAKTKEEITQKVRKQKLSFLYTTYHHDLFYLPMKYYKIKYFIGYSQSRHLSAKKGIKKKVTKKYESKSYHSYN